MKFSASIKFLMIFLGMLAAGKSANACPQFNEIDLNDIKHADVVVVGQVKNYKVILNNWGILKRKRILASNPELQKIYGTQPKIIPDHAQFEVIVEEVLHGKVSDTVTVIWNNSTFGEPKNLPADRYLIAFRKNSGAFSLGSSPNVSIFQNQQPKLMTILQAPCSGAFILENSTWKANKIRKILRKNNN